jgi:NADH dehydrogenase
MILITGCTGFVGRNLVSVLAASHKIRCLVRDPGKAVGLEGAGCEIVTGDVTDGRSVLKALSPDVDVVIHLVGILAETKGVTFKAIHTEGTRNVVEACLKKGVTRYLHISALGTRPGARSEYHRTKWEAERIIADSGLEYTIFRPSVIFGSKDKFTNMFARVMRISPVVMLPGRGRNMLQPVFVENLVGAMSSSIDMEATKFRVYEIAGPRAYTFDEIVDKIALVMGRSRPLKIHIPMPVMKRGAALAEAVFSKPPITRDQLLMLQEDNITSEKALEDVFGIEPTGFEEGMRTYLR